MTLKANLLSTASMTPAERAMGRFMRAPDHDGGSSGTEGSSGDESQDNAGDESSELTTEQQLEKEFGQEPSTPDDDDDAGEHGGEESSDDEEGEEGDDDEEGEEEESSELNEDGTPKSRGQKRIDALTAASREAERKAAEATRDADYWRAKAEKLETSSGKAPDGEDGDSLEPPNPEKYKFGEADVDFIRDTAKYEAKIEIREEQAVATFNAEVASLEAKWQTTVAKSADKYPDYQEVVVQAAKDQKWKCPPVIAVGIKDSEYGVDISYDLATNPVEADRIASLSPLEQAREFGRLEERHAQKVKKPEEPKTPTKKTTKAPTPPKKRIKGSGGRFLANADTDDFAAFERMADKKLENM